MGWQDVAALGLVGVALAYLGRRMWRTIAGARGAAGCAKGCGACPSAKGAGGGVDVTVIGRVGAEGGSKARL